MSSLTKICFDASYHKGTVGIGIFNYDTKEEVYYRYQIPHERKNSEFIETMALVQTLKYMKQNRIRSAHLFTDNQGVAKKGVSKTLTRDLREITINWIPREFNEDADRLSKLAHKLVATKIDFPKEVEVKNPRDNSISVKNAIKKYPLAQKLAIIDRITKEKFHDILYKETTVNIGKKSSRISRLLKSFLTEEEFKNHINYDIVDKCFLRFNQKCYTEADLVNFLVNMK